ncbi:zinc-binding dehydrogenase [Nonomuraea rosea]|uniref:Zinc-binding dehydrogenase n=1 Tax=Nonomuraea rosea TaxID=638574 RepID=A0ABP6VBG9_9ACTN
MRVIQATRFGGPEVLSPAGAPDPVAGPGQVVIRVAASDVLSVDLMIRTGAGAGFFPIEPPYVPGNGVAGQVIATGDGVDPAWTGRTVAAHTGGSGGWGGYAEQAAVPAEALIPVPGELGAREAAALLHDGVTALGLIERIGIEPGDHVLVTAAGGGMGLLLVQLAKAAGAHVIGAARGRRKLDAVEEAGADAAIDYAEPGWAGRVRELTGGRGADLVFDGAGGRLGSVAFGVTADGGRFSAHGMSAGFPDLDKAEAERRGITIRGMEDGPFSPADFLRLAGQAFAQAAAGTLRPVIGQTFPLDRAADAHAAMEARQTLGKSLLIS